MLTKTVYNTEVMPQVKHKSYLIERMLYYKFFTLFFNIIELFLITVSFFSLYFYRLSNEFNQNILSTTLTIANYPRILEYTLFYGITIILFYVFVYKYRIYKFFIQSSLDDEIFKTIKGHSYAILIAIGIAFLLKINIYSRWVLLTFWGLSIILSTLTRAIKRLIVIYLAKKGLLYRSVLIIGAGNVGQLIAREYINKVSLGFKVVGFIDDNRTGVKIEGLKVLGGIKDIEKIISIYPVDDILITIPSEKEVVDLIIKKYRKFNINIKIIPEMFNLVTSTIKVEIINSLPYMTLIKTPMLGLGYVLKRFMDLVFSFLGLILITPLLLIISLLIKLDSPGPVLFKQRRVGRNGKIFNMYKFRSMVVDAEDQIEYLKDYNEADGPVFKIKNDPRITRVGRIIRKYSIDELPQLFNVFKGEMSLVGPRPPLPHEVNEYKDGEWRRLEVLPGITGLWQVSGRSDLSFNQWLNLDIYYIENWSIALDIKILLNTIPVVFKGKGAY